MYTHTLTHPHTYTPAAFKPQSKAELKAAVRQCIRLSPIGNCSKGLHGPIGDWDVSAVTSMDSMFFDASDFNQDLSKWDVSAVTEMNVMFFALREHKAQSTAVEN